MEFVHQSQLPFVGMSHEFIGAEHGGTDASFFLVIGEPGRGPRLHKHNYDEIVYVIAGHAKWIVGNERRGAMPGDVLVVKAGEPHKSVSADDDPVRQIDIHLNRTFETVWLE
jgi:quercetin dioxygenase-like cupin family protein